MSVIPLTIFFSLLLAGLFIVLFAQEQRRRFASAERDSLLPLADETSRTVGEDENRAARGLHRHQTPVPPAAPAPAQAEDPDPESIYF